ncbi:MAG: DUF4149 domain-containing protein [Burkholderiales bacterium]|nr:MAG: DUF4149 domain-containing protein [Burkholderiales bacterium]
MAAHFVLAGIAGTMLFFTVAVAPFIFRVLPAQWAAVYVRSFFPKYYAVLGAASLVAAWLAGSGAGEGVGEARAVALAVAALFAVSLVVLTPAINRASDAKDRRRFGWLHGASIVVNLGQLGALLWVLWRA